MGVKLPLAIEEHYSFLNDDQRQAVAHTDGPLLIIAGPGSGKTLVLVVRTLNILLQGKAEPEEIVLCTFTEKAAFELRDRVAQAARTLGYKGDLSPLQVGTIHGICNDYLTRFRHHTWLGTGYEVLDELTQALFLFDNFETIVGGMDTGTRPMALTFHGDLQLFHFATLHKSEILEGREIKNQRVASNR